MNTLGKEVRAAELDHVLSGSPSLGRQAISHVIDCRPTLYKKVLDTCNLLNWHKAVRLNNLDGLIVASDIIVCGFRIRDYSRLCAAVELDDQKIATAAAVPLALVQALSANYRLHLDPVLKVYEAMRTAAQNVSVPAGFHELERLKSKGARDNIAIDRKPFINIQKTGKDDSGNDIYVLNEHNVVSAPTIGHPWVRSAPSFPSGAQ